ncbi:protein of unknown function (plasmid) [Azospirillum lipoferum 4B]|uniref:Uncharacterized protein n=1 Tax=Azospirillum lipoferum (strain 4B) TaxID=862719 RepID=G7Z493_AZOL4|nr:protein of unknown function [Azospirillum lipoferum 4B]CBS91538.1 protein of unknown function [Azospirillum lipoferum 4B]
MILGLMAVLLFLRAQPGSDGFQEEVRQDLHDLVRNHETREWNREVEQELGRRPRSSGHRQPPPWVSCPMLRRRRSSPADPRELPPMR